jgi:hypothetical protein
MARPRFRPDAAGTITSASTSSAPTIFNDTTIATVSKTTNTYSSHADGTPATRASDGLTLSSSSAL